MKKLAIALVFAASCKTYIQPTKARADWDCGPTICSRQWFCGLYELPPSGQYCYRPVVARYCETRVCSAYGGTYLRWTWWPL